MTELRYANGDVVFHEGDQSNVVALITSGTVEVATRVGDSSIVLGTVKAGEFVGEMGVIEGRPRSATVRATSELAVTLLSKDEFLQRISDDGDTAFQTLLRLSERLNAVNLRLAEATGTVVAAPEPVATAEPTPAAASSDGAANVRLLAGSDRVAALLPPDGLVLDQFPFHIGRKVSPGEPAPPVELSLAIDDPVPYRISRLHLSIMQSPEGPMVRDVVSKLGTHVNDEFIGEQAPKVVARLKQGENTIVAGGHESPYVFRIVLD